MPFFRRQYPSRRNISYYRHYYPANYYVDSYDRDYYLLPPLHEYALPSDAVGGPLAGVGLGASSSSGGGGSSSSSSWGMSNMQWLLLIVIVVGLYLFFQSHKTVAS